MGQKFLMDTNIVIDALGNVMPEHSMRAIAGIEPIVSAVTYIETLLWYKATSIQLAPVKAFLNVATILPIDQSVIEKTIIYRSLGSFVQSGNEKWVIARQSRRDNEAICG